MELTQVDVGGVARETSKPASDVASRNAPVAGEIA